MQLTAFRSGKGDCLLLTNATDTARILIDGGMPAPFSAHVAPALAKLRAAKKKLDLVYISHIDEDHIGGVLRMLDAEVLWRVHEHQKKVGNKTHKPPTAPRPPEIAAIWHNAFAEQFKTKAGEIEDALAVSAPILTGASVQAVREEGLKRGGLVTSIRQAIQVSRRIGPKQLGIPLNAHAGGKLMMVRSGQKAITIGGMKVTIVGPLGSHLDDLRKKWKKWVESQKGKDALSTIREQARAEEERLGTSDFERLLLTIKLQAEAFGDPGSITPENLASLMLLVEQDGQSILLTGDARWDQLVKGLEETGRLGPGQTLRVDVLKVPHHGSRNNITDTDFLDRVAATDYVFCGNGEHGNPHREVVEEMFNHRLKQDGRFKFWFNSSAAVEEDADLAAHMADVEKKVRGLAKKSNGRLTFKFLENGSAMRVI
jgi:beta-lactamase superfamily II metal-dependent hydrolase